MEGMEKVNDFLAQKKKKEGEKKGRVNESMRDYLRLSVRGNHERDLVSVSHQIRSVLLVRTNRLCCEKCYKKYFKFLNLRVTNRPI